MVRILAAVAIAALLAAACADDGASPGGEVASAQGARRPLVLTAPGDTPPVEVAVHDVPLEEIVFDTFDGGSVTLAEADRSTIDRLFDAIAPLDAPDYETVGRADEWLRDDDLVLAFVDGQGRSWAYPVRILNLHEIVNDELAGRPVLVSYCPLCASGVVYDRNLAGRELSFSNTSALHDNDLVMVDRETGSYWWQVAGRAIVGPATGASLDPLPSEMVRWPDWRAEHPSGFVLARPAGRDYSRDPFTTYADSVAVGRTPFPVDGEALADDRLGPATRVIAVEIDGEVRAWPVSPALDVADRVGASSVRVVTDGTGGSVTDAATGVPLGVRSGFWFSIVAAFPAVTVGPS